MPRHPIDTVSLLAGLFFLGVVGVWAVDLADLLPDARGWLLPVVLIALGVVGLLSARPRRVVTPATGEPEPHEEAFVADDGE